MPRRLPLFPLSLVLFPGSVLPLHVFEPRYRTLVRELRELPEPDRVFGVIAIRQGREVGADGVTALHPIGCTAQLRQLHEHEDGRFDLVTTGGQRFALHDLEHDQPYLVGTVDPLDDPLGSADLGPLDAAVRSSYDDYLSALTATGVELSAPTLPGDSLALSYAVAATVLLDLGQQQALLETPDAAARLRSELGLLRRERQLVRAFSATPAPELTRTPISPN